MKQVASSAERNDKVSHLDRRRPDPPRLRVLCLNYEYPPMGGGAGNATQYTALELTRLGHTVHVLTARLPGQSDVDTGDGLVVHRTFSRRIHLHQAGLIGALTFLPSAFLRLRKLAKAHDYDIFHFYFGLPTGMLALYVRWVLKKPYIIALRGSDVPGYDNTRWYLRPLHGLLAPLNRYVWSRAAAVTALSNNLRELALATAPNLPIRVVGNGIDTEVFPRRPKPPTGKRIRLLCVCRLVRRKGLEYLLRAMPELARSGMTLDIVGTGECSDEVESLVERLDLTESVNLVGYVPRDGLADYYNRADIFILPSTSESFGQVLLEAMSCGLPVVASRVGGVPETLHDGDGGLLIDPASSESIVAAIRRLASDPAARTAMGAYNHELARNAFQWSGVAEKYEALYLQCLGESNPKARARLQQD